MRALRRRRDRATARPVKLDASIRRASAMLRPPCSSALRGTVPPLQFPHPGEQFVIDHTLEPRSATALGKQRDDTLKPAVIVEHAAPHERRVQSIKEITNSFERRRQRLECIDPAAVLDLAYPRPGDAERALPVPVVGALRLSRPAECDHDGMPRCPARVQPALRDDGTE